MLLFIQCGASLTATDLGLSFCLLLKLCSVRLSVLIWRITRTRTMNTSWKFMNTSWKPLERSLLYASEKNGQQFMRERERERERESNDDDGRSKDATADENVKVVHTLVMRDRRRDLRGIASEVGIAFGSVQSILTDILGMTKVSARKVPRMLTNDQKRTRLDISRYLLSRYEDDPGNFIERVVTQDETWAHHLYQETKMQS